MKKFIEIPKKDKEHFKMINQSEKGFDLVVTSDKALANLQRLINTSKNQKYEVYIVWQMKFKLENHIVYKDCIFSEPVDNYFVNSRKITVRLGKKISVKCSGKSYYSSSFLYKNRKVNKTNHIYKDSTLLERMLKIGELDIKSKEYEL
jgi:hypothetical protein